MNGPSAFIPRVGGSSRETFVIVGAGQAGAQAAITLHERGFEGRIVLLGEERQAPYMRPPLSKKSLSGKHDEDRLYLRPGSFYDSAGIELRAGVRVEFIDRCTARLHLGNGEKLAYDKLLLATGTRARPLQVPGGNDPSVHYLRTLDDVIRLRAKLAPTKRLAVVGGGYLGLEVAATAAQAGLCVTVLEVGERVLERVTTATLSDHMTQVHRSNGVDVRTGTRVEAISSRGEGHQVVEFARGAMSVDLTLVAIGALPNDGLAQDAGLVCANGIAVDQHCRTSDPAIFAAGDCTSHPNAIYGKRLRLESVQNAVDQASVAAINMMGGELPYTRVPWFWSQQYALKLQSAGLFEGFDEVIERGDRSSNRFALLYRQGGELIAVDAVNMPAEYLSARKAIALRGEISIADAASAPLLSSACIDAFDPQGPDTHSGSTIHASQRALT